MLLLGLLSLAGLAVTSSSARLNDGLPSYVTQYAPILHLHSQEAWNPSDIASQITHTVPEVNYTPVSNDAYTLETLDQLNSLGNTSIYLTSKEGIQALPDWFRGVEPDADGVVHDAKTCAVVVVDKPDVDGGVVDVFYFYFYAYNQGNHVKILVNDLGEFGDHVGDWEHSMVRFKNGQPQALWLSQHSFGEAFTYSAMQKQGDRPVAYVGNGTHATWAIAGTHDHTLQVINLPGNGVLTDFTDNGPLYDPIPSAYFYRYDLASSEFEAYDSSPTNWLYFGGQWGDQQLPDNAPGQAILFGNAKYSGGPNGPLFKDLDRTNVCPKKESLCVISPVLTS